MIIRYVINIGFSVSLSNLQGCAVFIIVVFILALAGVVLRDISLER